MRTHDTERVREYAARQYIQPARRRGDAKVKIVAGDVHRALRLTNRVPLVCSALASREFLQKNRLRLERREGPPSLLSTTVTFTYALENQQEESGDELFYQLRGAAKEAFRQLGGGEAFLRSERRRFSAVGRARP